MGLFAKVLQARKLLTLLADLHRGLKDLPTVESLDAFLLPYKLSAVRLRHTRTLDIGCGMQPKNPFQAEHVFGIDIRGDDQSNVKYADLTVDAIPYPDNNFDFLTAFDFLEHVPRVMYLPARRFPFVCLMSEAWRVLKPDALFVSSTPIYPFSEAYRDPTHVNVMTHETFSLYFDDRHRWAAMYGFEGAFEVLRQSRRGSHLLSLLRKVAHPQESQADKPP